MKRNTLYTLLLLGSGSLLFSCSEELKLDQLLKKKSELRKELSELQEEINKLEKVDDVSTYPLVTIGKIEEKAFVHKISVQGNVETDQDAVINAELGGLVSTIYVNEGDRVEKGETFAYVYIPKTGVKNKVLAKFSFYLIATYGIGAIADGEQIAWVALKEEK